MKHILLFILLLSLSSLASAQKGFSTIEERMTGKEFTEAGLDKLSASELAALNEWLRSHSVATMENAQQPTGDMRGFEVQAMKNMDDSSIVSRIEGPFSGWDGDTVFKLENGMVWKQKESGKFYVSEVQNPSVTIDRGLMRAWYLKVEGYNKEVRVERIQ